jgi:hypothetical protein
MNDGAKAVDDMSERARALAAALAALASQADTFGATFKKRMDSWNKDVEDFRLNDTFTDTFIHFCTSNTVFG